MSRAVVAMSGGVDSAAAAILMQQRGYEVEGVTMHLSGGGEECLAAAKLCADLGIPHRVADLRTAFEAGVISPFVSGYAEGKTPNPCVFCNREIKFGALFDLAMGLGADVLATGHYARVQRGGGGDFLLKKAARPEKDQSYVLYTLTQRKLGSIHFPLGELSKEQARDITRGRGLSVASRPESQDICFLPGGEYASFVEGRAGDGQPGEFALKDGTVLGRHRGIARYTVGQRRGLGIAWPHPLYVISKDAATGQVILGPEADLMRTVFFAGQLNWISGIQPEDTNGITVRTRYHQRESPCALEIEGGVARVILPAPVRAPAPGQAAVFYRGDIVLGGGTIISDGEAFTHG